MEHQKKKCHVDFAVADGKRFEPAISHVDVGDAVQSFFRGRQHRAGLVDGDNALDEGCQRLSDGARSATEVGDGPALIEQAEQRDVGATAEKLQTHAVPLSRGSREKLLGAAASLGDHGLDAPRIMLGGVAAHHFVPDQVPQPAAGGVEGCRRDSVVAARSLGACFDPTLRAQHLEMPADGGLGQLEN